MLVVAILLLAISLEGLCLIPNIVKGKERKLQNSQGKIW